MGKYLLKEKETFLFHSIVKILRDAMIDFCTFVIKRAAETQTFLFLKSIIVRLLCKISYPVIMNSVR